MTTALATIFVFGLIVFIHELGHFITAKMSGMQVDEFAIGFGPAIFKVQRGETLYSIRIIPLGGFNRIAGMTPDEPLDERSFYTKPAWKKFIVISAGAVFMGANTYIGNAPNFMVKSISDENGVKMPSFFGYIGWSLVFLVPVFILDMLVFFM